MGVMLAGVEIQAASALRVAEARHVVRHHMPGFEGDIIQDLGRGPSVLALEGILHGQQATIEAESLRSRFRAGAPVEMVAALATIFEVGEVLIRDLALSELAGWPDTIRIHATVVEHIEPPRVSPSASGAFGGLAGVAGVSLEGPADAWDAAVGNQLTAESLARQIVNDPASAVTRLDEAVKRGGQSLRDSVLGGAGERLAGKTPLLGGLLNSLPAGISSDLLGSIGKALTGDPAALKGALLEIAGEQLGPVLAHVGGPELTEALKAAADTLGDGELGDLLRTVADDPSKLGELVERLREDPAGTAVLLGAVLGAPDILPGVLDNAADFLATLDPNDLAGSIAEKLGELTGPQLGGILSKVAEIDIDTARDLFIALRDADSLSDVVDAIAEHGVELISDLVGEDIGGIIAVVTSGTELLDKLKRVVESAQTLVDSLIDLDPLGDVRRLGERRG